MEAARPGGAGTLAAEGIRGDMADTAVTVAAAAAAAVVVVVMEEAAAAEVAAMVAVANRDHGISGAGGDGRYLVGV